MDKIFTARNAAIAMGLVAICLISASIGGHITQRVSITFHERHDIGYSELISIVLTSIAVLLAALGVMIGLMAIVGWATFRSSVDKAVVQFLDEKMIKGGPTFSQIVAEVEEASSKAVVARVFEVLGTKPLEDEFREDS